MIIDLSHQLREGMPTYPGDPKLQITIAATFTADNNLGHSIQLGTHAGTHIDAPAHMLADGRTLDSFAVDRFVGRGRCITVKHGNFSLETVKKTGISNGDIVLFNTGTASRFNDLSYFTDYPVLPTEIVDYLIDRQVSMVGLDTCSADKDLDHPVHKRLLSKDTLIIENLTNLEQLTDREFTIYALPIKLNLDGAPARVIAVVTET